MGPRLLWALGCSFAWLQSCTAFLPAHLVLPRVRSSRALSPSSQDLLPRSHVLVRASEGGSGGGDDGILGITDLGSADFGRFGTERDPFKDIQPVFLDHNPEWLKAPGNKDIQQKLAEVKQRVQGVNFFLCGMMGCGKTTVGRMLAEGMEYRWMDVDAHVEKRLNKTATEVFEQHGEDVWRQQETETLRGLQTFVQTVVSTGGGILTRRENVPLLHTGLIVWLDLDAEAIVERMRTSGEIEKRPLLKNAEDPTAEVRKLAESRRANYSLADVRVEVNDSHTPVDVVRLVASRVIDELDKRPPKAKAWEEKRERMKRMWDMMQQKGQSTSINPSDKQKSSNPAIKAIKKLAKQKAKGPFKGFAVKKDKSTEKASPPPAEVGSQGLGFGLGLDSYLNNDNSEANNDGSNVDGDGGDEATSAADALMSPSTPSTTTPTSVEI